MSYTCKSLSGTLCTAAFTAAGNTITDTIAGMASMSYSLNKSIIIYQSYSVSANQKATVVLPANAFAAAGVKTATISVAGTTQTLQVNLGGTATEPVAINFSNVATINPSLYVSGGQIKTPYLLTDPAVAGIYTRRLIY